MNRLATTLVVIGAQAVIGAMAPALTGAPAEAAASKKRVCRDHLHTGEAKSYTAGAALIATAKQNWSLVVTQHDGASWANIANATSKSGDCGVDQIVKGKGTLYFCTATARPCRWQQQFFPSLKRPPAGSGQ